ncbi:MAG: hypothetical protein JW860_14770 [Sedimentisphaerales bacterium]|nr:hypothetical protein [Sedimentisphaerales bacterium]
MLTKDSIKHRAIVMAINTGQMPEVEIIWSLQKQAGQSQCFGQDRECSNNKCIWYSQCRALVFYADARLPVGEGERAQEQSEAQKGKSRDKERVTKFQCRPFVARTSFPAGTREDIATQSCSC